MSWPSWPKASWWALTDHSWCLEFRVQGSGFRVQGSGFRVQGSGFRVQGSGFRVQGSRVWALTNHGFFQPREEVVKVVNESVFKRISFPGNLLLKCFYIITVVKSCQMFR